MPPTVARRPPARSEVITTTGQLGGRISYLTHWRLDLAAELLVTGTATLDSITRDIGYGSGFALSTAFRRARGVGPGRFRAGVSGAG